MSYQEFPPLPTMSGGAGGFQFVGRADVRALNQQNNVVTGQMENKPGNNDCFNNSLLNCLANTPLREIIMSKVVGVNTATAALQDIFRKMEEGQPNINTRPLREKIDYFNNRNQHCVFEFFDYLLNKLVAEERGDLVEAIGLDTSSPDSYDNYVEGSEIRKLFTWLIECPVVCPSCETKTTKYEPRVFLKLMLPKESDGPFIVSDCLQESLSGKLEMLCGFCKK